MSVINIYKDKPNTMWKNDETFLCVFDKNDNLVADYDFCTGLKLMQNDKEMTIFIHEKDLVPGKWILFASKVDKDDVKETIQIEGFTQGESDKGMHRYWSNFCKSEGYVSYEEREERLFVCKECPFFNKKNMHCKANNEIVLEITKYERNYCPKEKWGNKEKYYNGIIFSQPDKQDQEDFEKELEEYLKGL